jgi:MFS family permease
VRTRPDVVLIYVAALVRSTCVGLVGVVLAIHLSERGLSIAAVGLLIGVGLAGSAIATVVVGLRGDRFGRKRTFIALALVTAGGYAAVGWGAPLWALAPLAFVGMLNGMGRDRGAAVALEQAVLPETTDAAGRTRVLAWYNVVLDAGLAIGALAGAVPSLLVQLSSLSSLEAHRITFNLCAGATMVTACGYAALSPAIEMAPAPEGSFGRTPITPRTKRVVARLAGLFALDSLGSGFLGSSLIAYWFFQVFELSATEIAALFFAARVLNAASHVAAAWLARRIGLLNTMVATHLPSSLFLMVAPMAPSALVASLLFLAREALVEMDVPTRQSYVMAIVAPRERLYASGMTNVTRLVSWAVAPPIAGAIMSGLSLAAPLVVGGSLKIAYDLMLFVSFRQLKPPEESAAANLVT